MPQGSDALFGLPIVLDTDSEEIQVGHKVLLSYQGTDLAVLSVDSKYVPNKAKEAKLCYGTHRPAPPPSPPLCAAPLSPLGAPSPAPAAGTHTR